MDILKANKYSGKTYLLTFLALVAFAANSVLCRMALKDLSIDPATFTNIRLTSGAFTLLILVFASRKKGKPLNTGSWWSALSLFVYALAFSLAYVSLDTGMGALILFTAVQITMILFALFKGHKLTSRELIGIVLAFAGFVLLVRPGSNAPPLWGSMLMILAGIGWAAYSIRGQKSNNALQDTAFNFLRSLPLVIIVFALSISSMSTSPKGIVLALISGAVTSGLGYTIWYLALRGLNNVQASVVQLSVPAIAALGGILFLEEFLTMRLVFSGTVIMAGIYLTISAKKKS